MSNDDKYRLCVGIVLLNADDEIFIGRRLDQPADSPYWQMPQGGVEDGEDPEIAVRRELYEETSITSIKIIGEIKDLIYYDIPNDLQGKFWEGKYIGQKQKWFFARFNGMDSEININSLTPEFREYKWGDIQDIPNIAIPFKKNVYKKILEFYNNNIANM
jgi:putative (di)nucleoside polyphosphate hydrolase